MPKAKMRPEFILNLRMAYRKAIHPGSIQSLPADLADLDAVNAALEVFCPDEYLPPKGADDGDG